ncbi:ribosylnicotinamide kinase [Tilletia horrida]|nr:ribosylnicotinamide kinase [Tilletia horrida]
MSTGAESSSSSPRVIFVGLGGGSCSGKTTLAKHILKILKDAGDEDSFILHQDDFAPREQDLPLAWNGDEQVRDWDTPHGSIDFAKMYDALRYIRKHAVTPPEFNSHDKLNVLPNVAVPPELYSRWASRFKEAIGAGDRSQKIVIVLVDGFLTYFDPRVRAELDVRFFTRCSRQIMKSRRAKRSYITAENLWSDPPGYYDNIVWPAYVLAHKGMFENEDVEKGALLQPQPPETSASQSNSNRSASGNGEAESSLSEAVAKEGPPGGPVRGLIILDERHEDNNGSSAEIPGQAVTMAEMVDRACSEIIKRL